MEEVEIKEKVLEFAKKYSVYMIILALCLICWVAFGGEKSSPEPTQVAFSNEQYTASLEAKLEQMVSSIYGAGESKVTITLSSQAKQVYGTNEKTTTDTQVEKSDKFQKETQVAVVNGKPIVVEEQLPKVSGVCVVAEGAGNKKIADDIRTAVANVLGIRETKVAVFRKN